MMSRPLQSEYMYFVKSRAGARFNLATSGVMNCDLADLRLEPGDLALHGPTTYGYGPLMERMAARFSVDPDCLAMPGGGASFANHLAFAALVSPGDKVLVEDPTYELINATLGYLQADVCRFVREAGTGWKLDPQAVTDQLTPDIRLVVLTNLHNPSSAEDPLDAILAVADAAAEIGALVLVDEVYLELTFPPGGARTAFRPGRNIVVTSSLTKAYGLSGLRCGWILAPPRLAERMRRLNDLFGVHPPHISERMGLAALDRLPELSARAHAILDANRGTYREILGDSGALDQIVFDQGTTVFPKLKHGDGDALFERVVAEFETSIVPGRFFGRPEHIRIGLGGDPAMTREGLSRLASALQAL